MTIIAKGQTSARVFKRATALLELHRGQTLRAVSQTLHVTYNSVATWRDNYLAQGLDCLQDQPRSGRPVVFDGQQRAKITALACSSPPQGRARWTLRLLADRVVELGYCEHLSHTQARQILKKLAPTTPEENMVHRAHGRAILGTHGTDFVALPIAT